MNRNKFDLFQWNINYNAIENASNEILSLQLIIKFLLLRAWVIW